MEWYIILTLIVIGVVISPFLEKREANKRRAEEEEKRVNKKFTEDQEQLYKVFLSNWVENKGKQYEKSQGYPIDWKIRRQAVLSRDNLTCQSCGNQFGSQFIATAYDWEWIFLNSNSETNRQPEVGYVCKGAHVHHIVKVSNGGTHELSNLKLLCESCHIQQDGHKALHRRVKTDVYNRTYTKNNKLKIARITHTCDICERVINSGEQYFGGHYREKNSYSRFGDTKESKICIDCFKRYDYRSKGLLKNNSL